MIKLVRSENGRLLKVLAASAVALAIPVVAAPAAHAATMGQWDGTALLESGGDWSINYSSDGLSVGGLQFQTPSWNAALDYLSSLGYNVASWNRDLYQGMPRSQVPGKDRTILAGEALLHLQGAGAWANGNASGSVSMFDGGPNPWGLPGTGVPPHLGSGSTSPSASVGNPSAGDASSVNSSQSPSQGEMEAVLDDRPHERHKCHDRRPPDDSH